jgi:hypothetical protein
MGEFDEAPHASRGRHPGKHSPLERRITLLEFCGHEARILEIRQPWACPNIHRLPATEILHDRGGGARLETANDRLPVGVSDLRPARRTRLAHQVAGSSQGRLT